MKHTLERLIAGEDLSEAQAADVLRAMTDADVAPAVKGAVLAALRAKGETAEELRGMALAMRDAALPLVTRATGPFLDTCGTGGDGSGSLNISTAAALVLAACGLPVVKHGNRSISSKSGSADVLEALGIALPPDPEAAAHMLERTGFTFLFAPFFHPAMKAVMPVRRALGVRTVFNMLGPLTNPARPAYQLLGAWSLEVAELMAGALSGMPLVRAFVVHGAPGWDEATPIGPVCLWVVHPGRVEARTLDPDVHFGIAPCTPEDLAGGSAADNAAALKAVFAGAPGPHRDAVVLNAALGIELTGRATGRDAVARAAEAIDQGAVAALIASLSA